MFLANTSPVKRRCLLFQSRRPFGERSRCHICERSKRNNAANEGPASVGNNLELPIHRIKSFFHSPQTQSRCAAFRNNTLPLLPSLREEALDALLLGAMSLPPDRRQAAAESLGDFRDVLARSLYGVD